MFSPKNWWYVLIRTRVILEGLQYIKHFIYPSWTNKSLKVL